METKKTINEIIILLDTLQFKHDELMSKIVSGDEIDLREQKDQIYLFGQVEGARNLAQFLFPEYATAFSFGACLDRRGKWKGGGEITEEQREELEAFKDLIENELQELE